MRREPDTLPETPSELEALYWTARTPLATRRAIIERLGRAQNLTSANALSRIFDRDRRLEMQMQVLQTLGDFAAADCQSVKFAVFSRAAGPTHPKTMRLGAMQSLSDQGDPRARPLLQGMANDPDGAIRKNARRLVEEK